MMSKKSSILLIVAAIASLLVSCGSSKNTGSHTYRHGGSGDSKNFVIPKSLPPQSHALLTEAKSWLGTPYKYGGEDKRGVDCSGLVLKVYKSALDIKLPRNSAEQAGYCSPLQKNQLMPGDLIFFATSGSRKKVSHVGIYVGDGKMVHSSSSKGVIVSNISDDYYVRTYAGAGSVDKYRAMVSGKYTKQSEKVAAPPVAVNSGENTPEPKKSKAPIPDRTAAATQKNDSGTAVGAIIKATPVESDSSVTTATPVVNDGSITYTPVTSLPQKAESRTPQKSGGTPAPQKAAPVTATPTPKVKPVTTSKTEGKPEPSVDQARKSVLNSIIEQKIDSILKP
ncbi:NlpC/P60 family protein [uncultured Duncaniella sp.]|mgnify:FL=1|uniref:C40 family peptidase n=1 Tax=uncultured Duncaniella sp. TaxID=2768039 RepID=UPI0025F72E42|nr:NlpC/P60 family protein [uncultured Duncaniella sp.]